MREKKKRCKLPLSLSQSFFRAPPAPPVRACSTPMDAPGTPPNPIAGALGAAARAAEGALQSAAAFFSRSGGDGQATTPPSSSSSPGDGAGGGGGVSTWPGAGDHAATATAHAHRRRAPTAGRVVAWRTARTDGRTPAPPHQAPPSSSSSDDARAELGRSTWTLLHTLAAQYPDRPSRGQRRDVAKLVRREERRKRRERWGVEGALSILIFLSLTHTRTRPPTTKHRSTS